MFVKCGHCPACQQEKANKRSARIRNQQRGYSDRVFLFFGLTYSNKYVPFIDTKQIEDYLPDVPERYYDKYTHSWKNVDLDKLRVFAHVPMYRNYNCQYERVDKDTYFRTHIHKRYKIGKRYYALVEERNEPLAVGSVPLYVNRLDLKDLKSLKGMERNCVGICYYKDVQDFIKRVKQFLKRKYGYKEKLQYYICSEYGAESLRPHFHILLQCPYNAINKFKRAICACWSYDDYSSIRKCIQIAKDAANYVASYVNCSSYVPQLFYNSKLHPKHSYSQGFGLGKDFFSLPALMSSFRERDMRFDCYKKIDGVFTPASFVYPSYIINRYASKFKGYSKLTSFEIRSICRNPATIKFYQQRACLRKRDLHKIEVMLSNKKKLFLDSGFTEDDFVDFYSNVWTIRASNLLKEFHKNDNFDYNTLELYDNISDVYYEKIVNDDLYNLSLQYFDKLISDPNRFVSNIQEHNDLLKTYNNYDKSKKVRNAIYVKLGYNV